MNDVKAADKASFLQALDCNGADELMRFLDQACGSDVALRTRVEELLRAHRDAGAFLGGAETPEVTHDEPIAERPGTVIGPYKLLEQIEEGGFGVVFMAEQQEPIRRKVALKVLKPGMDTKQVIARFEAERQALALMDHPNIAKVLDAGQTGSGRPYFVMDLVKGLPITEFCDQDLLTPKERLELFVSVCQAVQHAHQKGIIHRDLKPSNVLVTLQDGTPVVKVIDFGIAKALGQQLTDKSLFTSFAQMMGTPLYMSPEQVALSNVDVDTRSDVYSLGVLLYELLTGTTPFDRERLKEAGYDDMRRIIREEEPPKPSTRISTLGQAATTVSTQRKSDPKRLSQLFRGELDWIVMKALEKDRNRRYESASAFAADVERYLRDEPVAACPPSAWYRFRKFARRHRWGVAMTVMATAALVLVAGSMVWVASDHAAREAAVDGEADRALDEAVARLEEAKWSEAETALGRTEKLLSAAGRQQLPTRLLELQEDLGMVRRLEEIYSEPPDLELPAEEDPEIADERLRRVTSFRHWATRSGQRQGQYYLALSPTYERAFADYGIDVPALSVAEAAERIRARAIRLELAQALDAWSSAWSRAPRPTRRPASEGKQLRDVARAVDPDPWRCRLRDALDRGDQRSMKPWPIRPRCCACRRATSSYSRAS
jgi:serine/threonine protein kinase